MTVRSLGLWSSLFLAGACGGAQTSTDGPPGAAAAPAGQLPGNPFAGARFYLDADYAKKVEATAAASPANAALLRKIEAYPTAVWLDSIAAAKGMSRYLDEAEKQAGAGGEPLVSVFVVYNLPNRDCSAKSSAGELAVESGGEARYRTEFIDIIAAHLRAHPSQRVALIVEPDSLPNVATNLNVPKCAASEQAYRHSIAYAVSKLSLPSVSVYLDAAHAGWLGWDPNRQKIAAIFKEVLTEAGGVDKIRGFSTNVSNYNEVKGDDGKKLAPSNPCPDELTYVAALADTFASVGITNKGFIIDTSRDGRGGIRTKWGSWCNVKGAGLGERPRAAPAPHVDAYFWVKPPGESDGSSNASTPRFDAMCGGGDAAPDAPQAGEWFPSYLLTLAQNAAPPL
jgi:cellulose 1,4-beta-cellobiosidase